MSIETFVFGSTEEAYDDSQCNEGIFDGDVLVVRHPEGHVTVAVLVEAWPVAVMGEPGQFHSLDGMEGVTWETLDGGKYVESFKKAMEQWSTPPEPAPRRYAQCWQVLGTAPDGAKIDAMMVTYDEALCRRRFAKRYPGATLDAVVDPHARDWEGWAKGGETQ